MRLMFLEIQNKHQHKNNIMQKAKEMLIVNLSLRESKNFQQNILYGKQLIQMVIQVIHLFQKVQ